MARQSRHGNGFVGILAQHQAPFAAPWHKQVTDGLIVNFEIRQADFGMFLLRSFFDPLEQFLHREEDDSWLLCCTGNRVCFPTTGRTVRKHGGIVAVEDTVKKVSGGRFIHLSLRGALIEDSVESEGLILDALAVGDDALGKLLHGVVFRGIEYPRNR